MAAAYDKSAANTMLRLWRACSIDARVEFCRAAGPEQVFEAVEVAIGVDDGGVS
jgi:hypothetical protein